MKHHTKTKGDLGVLKVQLDLHIKGYQILIPMSEHTPFDLAAFTGSKFISIQVKYRTMTNGKIEVPLSTSWADKNGSHSKLYDKTMIDVFAVYCPDTDEVYYFDPKHFGKSVSLRVKQNEYKERKSINYAKYFKDMPESVLQ